jgi:hypothetical protein
MDVTFQCYLTFAVCRVEPARMNEIRKIEAREDHSDNLRSASVIFSLNTGPDPGPVCDDPILERNSKEKSTVFV